MARVASIDPELAEMHDERGVIVDVYSRRGAEYRQLRDGTTFRLDEIRVLNGQPVPPA